MVNCKKEKSYWQQAIGWIDYAKASVVGVSLLVGVAYLFYETIFAIFLLFPLLLLGMYFWKRAFLQKKRFQFQQQFKDALQAVSAALGVGYSVENAWREAEKELKLMYGTQALICREFGYMIRQLEMNVPLESILLEFAERTQDEEALLFATVFSVAKRSGGNLIEIIRIATGRITEKVDMRREMETVIASKKMEFRIMTAIPFAMIAYLKISFGEFVQVLYKNPLGVIVMSVCLGVYLVAYIVGRKMVEIEV